ncbi:MAG: hypothetical protein KQJ78_11185 [Deltaproteobacteria bacterium]|nr:hypothetical protein [Deltaproteobacteria bacterium]
MDGAQYEYRCRMFTDRLFKNARTCELLKSRAANGTDGAALGKCLDCEGAEKLGEPVPVAGLAPPPPRPKKPEPADSHINLCWKQEASPLKPAPAPAKAKRGNRGKRQQPEPVKPAAPPAADPPPARGSARGGDNLELATGRLLTARALKLKGHERRGLAAAVRDVVDLAEIAAELQRGENA